MLEYKTIMVTGGCGAIGSVVVNYLIEKYPATRIVNLDLLTYCGNAANIKPAANYKLYHGDICNATIVQRILKNERPELIIHLAAETHVDQSFGNSINFTRTNVIGTHNLLECVKNAKCPVKRFIHMSTDEVYGSVDDDQVCFENAMFAPSNPYAATKAAAEMLCHAYMKSFGLPIIITRCNNAMSPFQHPEKLIPCCVRAIAEGRKIPVHGRGQSKRTFIHAADIASALEVIAARGSDGNVYNIGTTFEYTVMEVIETILSIMRPEDKIEDWIEYVADRAFQDYRYCIDFSKLMALGWAPKVSFVDGVKDIIKHTC